MRIEINKILGNKTTYDTVKSNLKNQILKDFSSRHNKCVIILEPGNEVEMTSGQAVINLLLLQFYCERGIQVGKEDLFVKDSINQKGIEGYFNRFLERVKENSGDYDFYRERTYEIQCEMADFACEVNVLAGNTIDFLDFVEIENNDEEFAKLFQCDIPYGLQYNEIEAKFSKRGSDLIKAFNNHPKSNLSPLTRSETGINAKQLTQTVGYVGLKPDIDGNVIPKVIRGNFLHGLDNIEDYYINAKGTRLALCTNHKMTRKSGYLTRKLLLLMIDRWHDDSVEDCGTKHYVEYHIGNIKKLDMIDGRSYYDIIDGKADYDHLKTISAKKDFLLIGQTIALRSPVTCACGKHPCRTCYGKSLSRINKDLNTGLVAILLITNILTQRLLSAKHLLSTKTDKIDWGEDFTDAFVINMDKVYFSDEIKSEILINYPSEDMYNEDQDAYEITEFEIKNSDKKAISYKSPVTLYLPAKLIPSKRPEDGLVKISSESYGSAEDVFGFTPHNNMLSKSLQNILDLIESKDHLGITTYSDLVNKFDDLLIENDMASISSIHAEMISSALVVDSVTNKSIDWSKEIVPPYVINRVSKSVLDSPLSVSLAFERLNDQFSNLKTYMKNESSIMDTFFD